MPLTSLLWFPTCRTDSYCQGSCTTSPAPSTPSSTPSWVSSTGKPSRMSCSAGTPSQTLRHSKGLDIFISVTTRPSSPAAGWRTRPRWRRGPRSTSSTTTLTSTGRGGRSLRHVLTEKSDNCHSGHNWLKLSHFKISKYLLQTRSSPPQVSADSQPGDINWNSKEFIHQNFEHFKCCSENTCYLTPQMSHFLWRLICKQDVPCHNACRLCTLKCCQILNVVTPPHTFISSTAGFIFIWRERIVLPGHGRLTRQTFQINIFRAISKL